MLADTAKLAVQLDLKGNFTSNLKASQAALGKFDKQMTGVGSRAHKAGQQVGTGIRNGAIIAAGGLAFLATQVTLGLRSLATLEKATAQTNAVLKSTKGVSGQTAGSIRELAEEYEALNATIDDKVIQSGENLLLTFTNIRKEAFEPALKTALDLNTRLGGGEGGLQNTIKLLGKALNDPLKGLGALSKAGITFNKQQTDQIKALVRNNDLLGAQKLILAELGKRYGGAFAAEGKTAEGTLAGIGDAAEDLQKTLATGLFPVISKLLPKIRAALADPQVVATVQKLGDGLAGLFSDANLAEGGKILSSFFATAKAAAPVVKDAAVATLGAVKAAVSLFTSLPKEVQQLAIGAFAINKITGGLVTNLAGGLISSVLKQLVSGVVNVNGAVVNVNGGVGGVAGAAGAAAGAGGVAGLLKTGAKLAGGVGIAIIGIEALGALINATSTPEQRAATEQNVIDQNRQKRGGNRTVPVNVVGVKTGLLDRGGRETGRPTFGAGKQADDRVNLAQLARATNAYLSDGFRQMVAALKSSKTPAEIRAAVGKAVNIAVTQGRGNVQATKTLLATLKTQLKNTSDPKTRQVLKDAIAKVQAKIPGREYVQRQIAKADAILNSNKTSAQKIEALKQIQKSLNGKSVTAVNAVGRKIEAAKRAQVYATQSATQAIKDKDMSVSVSIPITSYVQVSGRDVIRNSYRLSRLENRPS